MVLKITNTLTKQKEEFSPLESGLVKFYQCGPTVYWTQHIGNIRASVMADLARRTFNYLGYDVNFVRNYTDVGHLTSDSDEGEDKMEKGAKREGMTPTQIADKYIKIFENDTAALNVLEPDAKPRATETVPEIIEMVRTLINKEFAYQTDLAIYFDISRAKDYTRLSRQILEEQKEGAGKGDVSDPEKHNPNDFALWFFKKGKHKNALQFWPSPWGDGFPGWHIECSAMIKKYLGDTIDVHMGGIEHIPVHHTNEIAQSESANDKPFVNYWIHNEHLLVNNGKMSKSEGTSYSVDEVIEKGFDPMALRYFFLQAHYRSKQNFTWEALEAAQNGLKNLHHQIKSLGKDVGSIDDNYEEKFIGAISDDFNSPQALAILQEVLKSDLNNGDKLATILSFDKVLGLKLTDLLNEQGAPQEIEDLAKKRQQARADKNWQESDNLRGKILELGYEVEDTPGGYILKKK